MELGISVVENLIEILIQRGRPSNKILFIRTEGALTLHTTYDNHPLQPIQPIPSVRYIALNELNRPKIDMSRPSMSSNDYR